MSTELSNRKIADSKSRRRNRIAQVIMACTLVLSVLVILVQVGVISSLVSIISEPSSIVHFEYEGRVIVCNIQPGSTTDSPVYKCIQG